MLARSLVAVSILGLGSFLGSAVEPGGALELPTTVEEAVEGGIALRLGEPSKGHDNIVSHVDYSADGKRALSAGWDWAIRIWDTRKGTEKKVIEGHEALVYWAWFCDEDKRVVSSSSDKTIRLWSSNSGKQLAKVVLEEEMQVGAISPDGKLLAAGTPLSDVIRLFDLTDKCKEVGQLKNEAGGMLLTLAFSPDGSQLASGGMFSSFLQIHDVAGKQVVMKEKPPFSPSTIAWAPDGKSLYFAGSDELAQWGIEENAVIDQMGGHDETSHGMCVSADGTVVYFGDGAGGVRGWNLAEGTQVFYSGEHQDQVPSVSLSPDGKTLMSGSHDATVRFWDVETSKEVLIPEGHTGSVQALAWSEDGLRLGSGSYDNSASVWDMEKGVLASHRLNHEYSVVDVAFVGDRFYSTSYDNLLNGRDKEGADLEAIVVGAEGEEYGTVTAFSVSGSMGLFGFDSGAVVPMDIASGELHPALDGHEYSVADIDWAPGGEIAATVAWDGVMRIFNTDGEVLFADEEPNEAGFEFVEFLTKDTVLVADGAANLVARNVSDGMATWTVSMGEEGWIGSLSAAPDGKTFAMFCSEGLTFRDGTTGEVIFAVNTGDSISAIAFSPDGKRLAVGMFDSTVVVWDVELLRKAK